MSWVKKLQKVNKIDKQTKYTVFGWIREMEKSFILVSKIIVAWVLRYLYKLTHVPMMLKSICILYYIDDEIFDETYVTGYWTHLSLDKKMAAVSEMSLGPKCHYGVLKINSKSDNICQWDLTIKPSRSVWRKNGSNRITIGISSFLPNMSMNNCYFNCPWFEHEYDEVEENIDYYILNQNGCILKKQYDTDEFDGRYHWHKWNWFNYGNGFGTNDLVSILLNIEKGEIRFFVNNIDQGIAYKNIKKSNLISYRLFVTLQEGD
eukprot:111169_1